MSRWDGKRATAENLPQRFWALVGPRADGECWAWLGGRGGKPTSQYGKFAGTSAHRIAYELEVGPIPEGFEVDHLCRNTRCVNPAHLEAVTAKENRRRQQERKTHCKRGHERTAENLYVDLRGHTSCRLCRGPQSPKSLHARSAI